jgi:hypothetical protein
VELFFVGKRLQNTIDAETIYKVKTAIVKETLPFCEKDRLYNYSFGRRISRFGRK